MDFEHNDMSNSQRNLKHMNDKMEMMEKSLDFPFITYRHLLSMTFDST